MARALRIEFSGAYYHIMARGNEQREIFRHAVDYTEFLRLLGLAGRRHGFSFHAYALMPNHYHLLVETTRGELSRGMHTINGLYSQFFNSRYQRVGHLFQGRFKALLIDKNSYWLAVGRYIHQNPVRAGLAREPWDYPWSSCSQMMGLAQQLPWLQVRQTLEFFSGAPDPHSEYRRFLQAQVEVSPWDKAVGQTILGSETFVMAMRQKALALLEPRRDFAYQEALRPRPKPEAVLIAVEGYFAKHLGPAQRRRKNPPEKMAALHLLRETAGLGISEIGQRFAMSPDAVSHALKRFKAGLGGNLRLADWIRTQDRALRLATSGDTDAASRAL